MPDVRPSLLENLSKTATRIRSRGPLEVWHLISARISDNLWSDDSLVVFFAPAGDEAETRLDLRLAVATDEDADDFARDIGTDSARTFAGRLSPTSLCYLVRDEERIVHSSWVTLGAAWTRELRGYVAPPRGDAYVYESFTRSDARGRGVYPFALRGLRADLDGRGVAGVWVAAEADNAPSVRAIVKAGFQESYRLAYRRRLGAFRLSQTGGGPARTLEISRRPPAR